MCTMHATLTGRVQRSEMGRLRTHNNNYYYYYYVFGFHCAQRAHNGIWPKNDAASAICIKYELSNGNEAAPLNIFIDSIQCQEVFFIRFLYLKFKNQNWKIVPKF